MLIEGASEIDAARKKIILKKKLHTHYWIHGLPLKLRFPKSRLYESAFTPVLLGVIVGFVAALIGVGGAFLMVPAMIYLLGMPTSLAIGTSLFQIIFVTANVTFLQALTVQTVDILLAVLLLTGAVIGAQFGSKYSVRMKGEQLRALLALLVLGVCVKMIFDLTVMPADLYSIALLMG